MVKLDTFETFTPIHKLLNIFALTAISRTDGRLKDSWGLSKYVTVAVISLISVLYFVLKVLNYFSWNPEYYFYFTDAIQITYLIEFSQYVSDVIYTRRFGRQHFLNYLKLYDYIDSVIGNSYLSLVKNIIRNLTVTLCCLSISISLGDYVGWYSCYSWKIPTLYSSEYFYNFLNMLVVIDMSANVIQIEYRLETMRSWLQQFYTSSVNVAAVSIDEVNKETWFYCFHVTTNKIYSSVILYDYYLAKFRRFPKCLLLLIEQSYYINSAYGFRIAICSFNYLLYMVNVSNITLRILFGIIPREYFWYIPVLVGTTRMIFTTSIIICLLYRCEQCYQKTTKIISVIDNILIDKKICSEMRSTLETVKSIASTRPIEFHASNFFQLRYSLIVSMASAIVTYTILMFQNMK